ncbi:MAG: metalloprotease [Thermoguttaceae bacterium]
MNPYTLHFRLFGFPVSIQPLFWVVIAMLSPGVSSRVDDLSVWLTNLLIWIAAATLSIIVHELGHAFVVRDVFGAAPVIELYAFGGVTIHQGRYRHRTPQRFGRILISAAGPFAGFVLAAAAWGFLVWGTDAEFLSVHLKRFLTLTVLVSVVWGILNLMPIQPFDGGHICREVCQTFAPRQGERISTVISILVAGGLAGFFLWQFVDSGSHGIPFNALLFGYLAYQSYTRYG